MLGDISLYWEGVGGWDNCLSRQDWDLTGEKIKVQSKFDFRSIQ